MNICRWEGATNNKKIYKGIVRTLLIRKHQRGTTVGDRSGIRKRYMSMIGNEESADEGRAMVQNLLQSKLASLTPDSDR